ncbi:hemin-degrading factor [Undibacterium parvum]|uniref:Hemin-degrading factor n=1 Tax=Undibacterium parvum TaxID=401471 RepID=A0A3Q9BNN4_9BURK|nr:ChuX/HutX family heme-like substrate-binding protein [Undibacterium parvum]AZP11058.1 hemin-degrading factor [Undibacterium parvum]
MHHFKHTFCLTLICASLAGTSFAASPDLSERWASLRAEQPKMQIRDAASKLGVSEAELLASQIGKTVTRLQDGPDAASKIMQAALDLGTVMALTRNENGVLERTGVATKMKPEALSGDPEKDLERAQRIRSVAGGYLGGQIDLRFTLEKWQYAFAVVQPGRDGTLARSLQFFDVSGNAIHKVYLKNEAGVVLFEQLQKNFAASQQSGALKIVAQTPKKPEKNDSQIDLKEFQLAWKEMSDVHQFERLLQDFELSREQALRLAPQGVAQRINGSAVRQLLDQAAQQQVGIMAFLGNGALTQIFSGKITKVAASGDWYNVLDPEFNLHLRDANFNNGWVVQRAGVTSVEFYDKQGELVVTFFGVRERAKPQPQSWIELTKGLTKTVS